MAHIIRYSLFSMMLLSMPSIYSMNHNANESSRLVNGVSIQQNSDCTLCCTKMLCCPFITWNAYKEMEADHHIRLAEKQRQLKQIRSSAMEVSSSSSAAAELPTMQLLNEETASLTYHPCTWLLCGPCLAYRDCGGGIAWQELPCCCQELPCLSCCFPIDYNHVDRIRLQQMARKASFNQYAKMIGFEEDRAKFLESRQSIWKIDSNMYKSISE